MTSPAVVTPIRKDPREACTATMRRALDFLQPDPKAVFEVSVFNPKHVRDGACWPGFTPDNAIVVGWFNNRIKAANLAHSVDRIHLPSAIYVTLNRVDPALLARTNNELQVSKKGGGRTADVDIIHLDNLLIDIDAAPKSGISTTGEEKAAAKDTLDAVVAFLTERGFPEPMVADSGNGFHAVYAIDMPVEDAPIVAGVLNALAARFDNGNVRVDRTVGNPARITKLYGTMVRKGAKMDDRPWRLSGILSVPENRVTVPHDLLVALAGEVKSEDKAKIKDSFGDYVGRYLDVDSYAEDHGIGIRGRKKLDSGTMLHILEECVFNPEHNHGEAAISQASNGALGYKCKHNSCQDKGWKEFRKAVSGDESLDRWMVGPKTEEKKDTGKANPWAGIDFMDYRAKRYIETAPPPMDFVFSSLRAGNLGIIVGPPGSGKTHLVQHIAGCIATGDASNFGGLFTVPRKGRVVIISAEDDEVSIHDRVYKGYADQFEPFGDEDSTAQDLLNDIKENLIVFPSLGMDSRFVDKIAGLVGETANYGHILKQLKKVPDLRLVVFDPLIKFYGGDENDNGMADFFCTVAVNIAQETGAAVLLPHHTVKGFAKGKGNKFEIATALHQDAARGASGFTAAAAWVFNLVPLPKDAAEKYIGVSAKDEEYLAGRISKNRFGKKGEPVFFHVLPDGMLDVCEQKYDPEVEKIEIALRDKILETIKAKEDAGEEPITIYTLSAGYSREWKTDVPGTTIALIKATAALMVSEKVLFLVKQKKGKTNALYLTTKRPEGEDE